MCPLMQNKMLSQYTYSCLSPVYRISTLLTACFGGWLLIRESAIAHFGSCYDSTEFLILIHTLEEIVLFVLYFYPVIFRKGNYQEYKDSLVRMAIMFFMHCRRHYEKATISQLSDIKHMRQISRCWRK